MPVEDKPDNALPLGALLVVLVIVFINFAGFSLIIPLLPFYGRELGASAVEVTMLFAAYSLGGVFGEFYWGRASDRIGRKRILIMTTACAAASYALFAFVADYHLALVIRTATGFFSGTVGVCASYIADVTKPEQRARSMGLMGAAINLGFAIGPALGGLLAAPEQGLAGFRLPILTSAAIAGLAAFWAIFALSETNPGGRERPAPHWGVAFQKVAASALLVRLFAIAFLGIGLFASMEAVFGLWTAENFSWSTHEVGLTFIAVGLAGFVAQMVLVGPMTKRYGEARVIVFGLCLLVLSMILQPIIRQPVAAVILMSLLMTAHSIAFPSAGALISRSTDAASQGSVNGLLMACNALSRIIVPPVFGFLYQSAGSDSPYYVAAALACVGVLIAGQVVSIREAQTKASDIVI